MTSRRTPALTVAARTGKLALSMLSGRPQPFSITFILTNRCNFQCDYCDVPSHAGDELTTAELVRAIDELADHGMARASFSGGEALIRKDAVDVIAHAHARGAMTSLNSNGWLVDRHLDRLAGVLDVLMISLDGPEPVHDLVRKKRGSYERVIRVIRAARERGIAVTTITVVSRANLHVVDEVLALASEHGFWAYFQPAYRECFDFREGLDPSLTHEVLERIARDLDDARREGRRVGGSPGYTRRLARGPTFGDCSRCAAGRYFATLLPDGTFVPCHLTSRTGTYPNGRERGFARAFFEMPHPTSGPGCAIAPYQEQDLIFSLDPRAIREALTRLVTR